MSLNHGVCFPASFYRFGELTRIRNTISSFPPTRNPQLQVLPVWSNIHHPDSHTPSQLHHHHLSRVVFLPLQPLTPMEMKTSSISENKQGFFSLSTTLYSFPLSISTFPPTLPIYLYLCRLIEVVQECFYQFFLFVKWVGRLVSIFL